MSVTTLVRTRLLEYFFGCAVYLVIFALSMALALAFKIDLSSMMIGALYALGTGFASGFVSSALSFWTWQHAVIVAVLLPAVGGWEYRTAGVRFATIILLIAVGAYAGTRAGQCAFVRRITTSIESATTRPILAYLAYWLTTTLQHRSPAYCFGVYAISMVMTLIIVGVMTGTTLFWGATWNMSSRFVVLFAGCCIAFPLFGIGCVGFKSWTDKFSASR